MFKFISSMSRKQKTGVFLGIDLALIPVALLITYALQSLPTTALATLIQTLPVLISPVTM